MKKLRRHLSFFASPMHMSHGISSSSRRHPVLRLRSSAPSAGICLTAILALHGCGGGGGAADIPVGPCSVEPQEAALAIVAAKSSSGGADISSLSIEGVTIDALPIPPAVLLALSRGITETAAGISCAVPCAFGTSQGTYRFTVAAPGYRAIAVAVAVSYQTSSGTCPALLRGPTTSEITLDPQ